MSRARAALAGVLGLVLVLLIGGYWYERPLLRTATGYAAHNACAVQFVAGRSNPDADLPDNPIRPLLRTAVTADAKGASSSILGVLAKQTAVYRSGEGCSLGDGSGAAGPGGQPRTAVVVDASLNPLTPQPENPGSNGLAAAMERAMAPGSGARAIVVVKGGSVVAERYADGFTKDTRQLGWSMSKSATNLVAGVLIHESGLRESDAQLSPAFGADPRSTITVEQLLRMTSGLEWDETYSLGTTITTMLYDSGDMGAFVAKQPLAHDPGTYVQYSSGSTNLLCDYLRRRYEDDAFMEAKLFKPLGLASAVIERDQVGTPVCSSYLWATPRDWATLGLFALRDGTWGDQTLLPDGWMRDSTKPSDLPGDEESYGAGWRSNQRPDSSLVESSWPQDAYWASGHDGQRLVVIPSRDLVIVRMGFSPDVDEPALGVSQLVADVVAATP